MPRSVIVFFLRNHSSNAYRIDQIFALMLIIQIFINATIAGASIIAALTMVFETAQPQVISGLVGFVLSVPAYWSVARARRGC